MCVYACRARAVGRASGRVGKSFGRAVGRPSFVGYGDVSRPVGYGWGVRVGCTGTGALTGMCVGSRVGRGGREAKLSK
jgi:hypothetical protein